MKKVILSLSLMISSLAFSQTHDVSLNLAPMVVNNFSGAYFYNFEDQMSVGSVIGYQNLKIGEGDGELKYTSFYVAPEFRYYFDPEDENDNFYVGGYLKFRSASSNDNLGFDMNGDIVSYDITRTGLAIGATFGRIWATDAGFFFNPWTGFGVYLFDNDKTSVETQDLVITNLSNVDFRLGLSVGWRF